MAKKLLKIYEFKGENFFLSNFFKLESGRTLEHYYQAEKTDDMAWKFIILEANFPGEARRLGRRAPLRENWDRDRVRVMEFFVEAKFRLYESLKMKLLATNNAILEEGNKHGDTFWGKVNGKGENHLGKILMRVRDRLRDEEG